MEPSIEIALLWLLFGGTHIGLATRRLRGELVARLGAGGFTLLFWLVAAASFSLLVHHYALHRFEGVPALALGRFEAFRWVAMAAMAAGMALLAGSLWIYPRSPMAVFAAGVSPPHGLERITRHPFSAGFALLGLAHVLLATHLVGAVFFAGLALLAIVGARHQDAKLLGLRGEPYARYVAETSGMPFAAIASGRQHLVWRELPLGALALGLALSFALRTVHGAIFDHGGAWVIVTVVGGAAGATLQAWRRSRSRSPAGDPLDRVPL